MPAERRSTFPPPVAKPMRTERTHEENQERAYIAASRRGDRSLEARIESARRASEIHKKRTGRALRVTEQDVINEEMYEEEDDDLPTQYQRLNAHLQTSSWLFNRKLHDYIATQHGVRNMFVHQQFPGQIVPQYDAASFSQSGQVPMMTQPMYSPPAFAPTTTFAPSSQPYTPHGLQPRQSQQLQQPQQQQQQQQGFRQAPYSIPVRNNMHQHSTSISTPLTMPDAGPPTKLAKPDVTTPDSGVNTRVSLPPHVMEQPLGAAGPSTSKSPSNQTVQQPTTTSPDNAKQQQQQQQQQQQVASAPKSGQVTPDDKSENATSTYFGFPRFSDANKHIVSMNPLSLSLPPESQQLVGSALDPQDPRTAVLMAGSENLPQPFMGTYTYNPNISSKPSRFPKGAEQGTTTVQSAGMSETLAPDNLKLNPNLSDSYHPPSAAVDNMFTSHTLFSRTGLDYSSYLDTYQTTDSSKAFDNVFPGEAFEYSSFVNWNQTI